MSLKSNVTAGLVVALLAVVVAPIATSTPVEAQDQTSWYVNDDPSLYGPSRYWWWGDAGKGYGSNNYRFTFGSGGESGPENWARWSMGRRVGRQEIQVYVPNTKATATVVYRIGVGGREYTRQVAQRNAYGWTSLGNYDTDDANVTITLRDNEAAQHWNRHGYDAARIGVDAARMRCIARCSTHSNSPPPPPPPPPTPPLAERQVTLALGDDVGDSTLCLKDHLPCRWLIVTLEHFPAGSYPLLGLRQKFGYSEAKEFDGGFCAGYVSTSGQNPAHFSRFCYFNGQSGRYLHVIADGVKSNIVRMSGDSLQPQAPPPPPPPPPAPSERQVVISLGDDRNSDRNRMCPYGGLPCRWVNVTFKNFPEGRYWVRCVWQKTTSGSESVPIRNYINHDGRSSGSLNRFCSFNVQPSRYLHVTIDGVKSNTIRMSGSNIASPPPPPPPPPPAPSERQVVISLGDDRNSDRNRMCPYGGLPCRWVNVTLKNFPEGRYWVRCVWQKTTSGSESVPIRNYINHDGRSSGSLNRFCSFNVQPSRYLHVTIDGVKSNTIRMSGSNVASPPPPPPPPPAGDSPGRLGLAVSVDLSSDGSRTLVASWSPPSDDGGSPITGYTVTISRPGKTFGPYSRSANSRTYRITGARSDTTYMVRVVAKNRHGSSPEARRSITTPSWKIAQPPPPPPPPPPPQNDPGCPSRNKWTRERDGWWGSHRVVALKAFKTIHGIDVDKGEKGGIVTRSNDNLSQDGCSWIGYGARVVDEAEVKDAAFVGDTAFVHDHATVSGKARVYGDAEVRGNASISGNAHVYGSARVGGTAKVTGNARIFGNITIESGHFDGHDEFVRDAKDVYVELVRVLTEKARGCLSEGNWELFVQGYISYIVYGRSDKMSQVLREVACPTIERLQAIAKLTFSSALTGYTFTLLGFYANIANLSQFVKSAIDVAQVLSTINTAVDLSQVYLNLKDDSFGEGYKFGTVEGDEAMKKLAKFDEYIKCYHESHGNDSKYRSCTNSLRR